MSTTNTVHVNPYRDGNYHNLCAHLIKKAGKGTAVTLNEMREVAKTVKATNYDVNVVMSPREYGKCKGHPFGSTSARKEYTLIKLVRRVIKGVKEPQKFKFRWRTEDEIKMIEEKCGDRCRESKKLAVTPVKDAVNAPVKVEQKTVVKA